MPIPAEIAWQTKVVIAAPITPKPGTGPQRIEHEVQEHRAERDIDRQVRPADAAHDRLEDEIGEGEDRSGERHAHEAERAGIDVGRHAHQPQQRRRAEESDDAEHDGDEPHHQQGLARDMADHALVARADILGDQGRARHRQAAADREGQEHRREAHRHRGDRRAAEAPDPERVDQLIGRLQCVRRDDRDRERQQRAQDRPFEKLVFGECHAIDMGRQDSRCNFG
jgi:hypothetical protein